MSYQNKALIFEIISDYGFSEKQVDEVIKLAESESGKFIQSPAYSYIGSSNSEIGLLFQMIYQLRSETIVIEEGIKNLQFAIGNLQI